MDKIGQYKAYLQDCSKSIPRTTLWRLKRQRLTSDPVSSQTTVGAAEETYINDGELVDYDDVQNDELESEEEEPRIDDGDDDNMEDDTLNDKLESDDDELESDDERHDADDDDEFNEESDDDELESDDERHDDDDDEFNEDQYDEFEGEQYNLDRMFEPLYDGANITICGAYCAIMKFKALSRCSLTTITHLLQLLQLLCPTSNNLPKSVYTLRKFFVQFGAKKSYTRYCFNCQIELASSCCQNTKCPKGDPDCFLKIDTSKQFRSILSRHWDDLQYLQPLAQSNNLSATTMFQRNKEFFRLPENLGVILNTDGVSMFKSSRVTIWPVYLQIANLLPSLQFLSTNIVTCGIWVGQKKPNMSLLFAPILENLERLRVTGFSFSSPEGIKTIRVKLLFGVFDLVAKAAVLNMKQFNGLYGCPTCLHPGQYLGTQTYPPGNVFPIRTSRGISEAVLKGRENGTIVEGIKGPSPLTGHLHLVEGVPADYMHCVLEGVVGSLLKFWTDSHFHQEPFSIRRYLKEIDDIFVKQKPPNELSRPPRSIRSHLSYWKASEFRNWILYYSLPLLRHRLPPLYFHHFALLVCSLYLLLQKRVSMTMCNASQEMLTDFYDLFPELYGASKCTMNVHSLIHLPYYVKLWGPLWTHSAFSFESMNGALTNMIHSTRKIAEQLSFSLDINHSLQTAGTFLEEKESNEVLKYLDCDHLTRSNMTKLKSGYAVGCIKNYELSIVEFSLVRTLCRSASKNVNIYERVYHEGVLFHSIQYRGGEGKRDNTVCSFRLLDGSVAFGQIQMFAEVLPIGTVVFVNRYTTTEQNILGLSGSPCREVLSTYADVSLISKFIVEVSSSQKKLTCIRLDNLISKCISVRPKDQTTFFVMKLPNSFECQ